MPVLLLRADTELMSDPTGCGDDAGKAVVSEAKKYIGSVADTFDRAGRQELYEKALMSRAAYNDDKNVEILKELAGLGWICPNAVQKSNGFYALVFENQARKLIVVAFAGTDPNEADDIKTDGGQAVGLTTNQYEAAKRIVSREIERQRNKGFSVQATGHSLGGGLAAATALVNGVIATTFNPAGVHRNTVGGKETLDKGTSLITAIRVKGDPLTDLQDRTPLPDTNGKVYDLEGLKSGNHSLTLIISRLKELLKKRTP